MTIDEIAREAGCSHWTVRRYLKRGTIEGLKDHRGTWHMERSAVRKIQRQLEQHGGPGGRSLLRG